MISSADYRQIAASGEAGRQERLFRAAIHAFCCLVRPTRRESAQLDDLAVPLLEHVPPSARRFAAAALSELPHAPRELVRRLCDEPAEIAAPLLLRSPLLADIDLVVLIGRHGASHARVMLRRPELAPAVAALARASALADDARLPEDSPMNEVDRIREELRAMMRPAVETTTRSNPQPRHAPAADLQRLVQAALTGAADEAGDLLAELLGLDILKGRGIVRAQDIEPLAAALRQLGMSEEQAFLVISCLRPDHFPNATAIRRFAEDWRAGNELAMPATAVTAAAGNGNGELARLSAS